MARGAGLAPDSAPDSGVTVDCSAFWNSTDTPSVKFDVGPGGPLAQTEFPLGLQLSLLPGRHPKSLVSCNDGSAHRME